MSVLKCCVSIYALTWCSHGRTLLVSFLMKESNNLAFMFTLVEPPLGAPLMRPNPFAIRPMNLVVSLLYVVVSPCYTTNVWKASRRAKNSLDILSTTFGLASFHVSRDLSIFYLPKPSCPLFLFSTDSKEESRNAHLHLIQMTSESQCV